MFSDMINVINVDSMYDNDNVAVIADDVCDINVFMTEVFFLFLSATLTFPTKLIC